LCRLETSAREHAGGGAHERLVGSSRTALLELARVQHRTDVAEDAQKVKPISFSH
jgi:hypothetical protein